MNLPRWFNLPRRRPSAPPTKSALRLQFESEWREAHASGAASLNAAALGLIDGVRLILQLVDALLRAAHHFFQPAPAECDRAEDEPFEPIRTYTDPKIVREERRWQEREDWNRSLKESL